MMTEDQYKKKIEGLTREVERLEDKVSKLDRDNRQLTEDNRKLAGRTAEDLLLNGEGIPPDWLVRIVVSIGRGARLPTDKAPVLFNKVLTWAADYVQKEVSRPKPRPTFMALMSSVRMPEELEPPAEPAKEEEHDAG